jgi:hypothetical protein
MELDIKLVETESWPSKIRKTTQYLTLSHCWGRKPTTITTNDNIEDRKRQIPFAKLPRTFQDAVTITRQLGQCYLWIDSLCVIQKQENQDDWAKEAAMMSQVYSNSLCTLAALGAKDGTEGCYCQGDLPVLTDNVFFDLPTTQYPFTRIFLKEPRAWQVDYDGVTEQDGSTTSPLRHRAWVLQERELSRRSIFFGRNQILWECESMKGSTQLPWTEMEPKKNYTYPNGWHDLIEDYSARDLTEVLDKLPALSGLAERHESRHLELMKRGHLGFEETQYLAGIWSDKIPAHLMWQSRSPTATRYSSYIAPTWSWASVQGSISFVSSTRISSLTGVTDPRIP